MGHQEEEFADVVVVLADDPGISIDDAVSRLKTVGLCVSDIDSDDGVIEGTVELCKMADLRQFPFVKYVRDVFNYTAELSPDTIDQPDEEDTDDAGR